MADIFDMKKRSEIMSAVGHEDTAPELKVRKYLFSHGFRYRKNDKRYPGHPDIVLPKYRTVIFVNGCFWHQHQGCPKAQIPKSNVEYWQKKLNRNVERDKKEKQELEDLGWFVIIIWECELSNKEKADKRLDALVRDLRCRCRLGG